MFSHFSHYVFLYPKPIVKIGKKGILILCNCAHLCVGVCVGKGVCISVCVCVCLSIEQFHMAP